MFFMSHEYSIFLYMPQFLNKNDDEHLGKFQYLLTINSTTTDMNV